MITNVQAPHSSCFLLWLFLTNLVVRSYSRSKLIRPPRPCSTTLSWHAFLIFCLALPWVPHPLLAISAISTFNTTDRIVCFPKRHGIGCFSLGVNRAKAFLSWTRLRYRKDSSVSLEVTGSPYYSHVVICVFAALLHGTPSATAFLRWKRLLWRTRCRTRYVPKPWRPRVMAWCSPGGAGSPPCLGLNTAMVDPEIPLESGIWRRWGKVSFGKR